MQIVVEDHPRMRIIPAKQRAVLPLPQLREGERRITSFFTPLTPLTAEAAAKVQNNVTPQSLMM